MKWFLEETKPQSVKKIQHGDTVLFIGSCFSENIFNKGRKGGFNFHSTDFGTLFHPIPIGRLLSESLIVPKTERILERDGRFYSWDAYSMLNGVTVNELTSKLQAERFALKQLLKNAKFLFLTFGSAKEYRIEEDLVVANCHKMHSQLFHSKLTELDDLKRLYVQLIQDIKEINPEIEIVLTVSPVRHAKDGLVQNNRSKSRLLLLCEFLSETEGVDYFPAYEIVIDELRDYRFFSDDLVHPNTQAIDYVWSKFQEVFMDQKTQELTRRFMRMTKYFEHRAKNEENEIEKQIRENKIRELASFLEEYPQIKA